MDASMCGATGCTQRSSVKVNLRKGSVVERGPGGLCGFHAGFYCDACGEVGDESLDVFSTSKSGRAFRMCRRCARGRSLAPGLATPSPKGLVIDRRERPPYEHGFARLEGMLPAMCRLEGATGIKTVGSGKDKKKVPTPARWWEIACPTVSPYDRLASLLDARFTRKAGPMLGPRMGVEGDRSAPTGGFSQNEYGYWEISCDLLPEPQSPWWDELRAAIPGGEVIEPASAESQTEAGVAKPKKRGRAAKAVA